MKIKISSYVFLKKMLQTLYGFLLIDKEFVLKLNALYGMTIDAIETYNQNVSSHSINFKTEKTIQKYLFEFINILSNT